jgi:glycosyltransferase involved in cell wall biosynthesis
VLSVSAALKQEITNLRVEARRVVVIPNGVEKLRFPRLSESEARTKLGIKTKARIVACVSRLSREKGTDVLIRAFKDIEDDDIELFVLGDGDERAILERLVADFDLGGRVHLVGAKDHADIPTWISASSLIVLPSRIEGHPNAVLEAMACGRPVVASRVGGVPEILVSEEFGLMVEPDDPDALADGIRDAINREWNHEGIREYGLRRSWDDVADEIMREIDGIVGTQSVSR